MHWLAVTEHLDLRKLNPDQRKIAQRRMLQTLLTDRFKLALHRESKEMPIYILVIAKRGSKLQEAKLGDSYSSGLKHADGVPLGPHMMQSRIGGGMIVGQAVPLESLVPELSEQLGRIVVDRTGLTGSYDFKLQWTPDASQTPLFKEPETERANPNSRLAPERRVPPFLPIPARNSRTASALSSSLMVRMMLAWNE